MTLKIIKNLKTTYTFKYFKRIFTFELPVLYSPIILVHFLGFLKSGYGRTFTIRIHADPDLQHWFPLVQN